MVENDEEDDLLNADHFCYACNSEENHNVLLVCDHCVQKCCHIYCLNPPLEFVPDDEWYCDFCVETTNIVPRNPTAGILANV